MTYATDLAAMVAALDATLAAERGRRRVRSTCVTCRQPESRCECDGEAPIPEEGPDRAGYHYPEGP